MEYIYNTENVCADQLTKAVRAAYEESKKAV